MGKIIKNYIYNLIYQLVALLVPLVTAPYLVRVLGAEGTGTYAYVNSLTALVTSIVMLGIFNYGNRQIAYVRDNKEELNATFWRIMSVRFLLGIVGTVVYVIVVWINGRYYFYFFLYYTYLLGYLVDCTWLFVGVEDMKWAVLKNTLMKLCAAAGIFLLVKNKDDVGIYIFIQGGSILFANLLAYTQLRRYVRRPQFILTGIAQDLKGSVALFLPGVAATIYLQCDKIMLELLTGNTAQVSQYDYAEKIVTIPLTFITVLSTVMMPRIANEFQKKHTGEIADLINKAAKVSLFLACPLMLGMMAIAGELIPWYLGNGFLLSIKLIIIISPIIITNTLTGISGSQFFTATNQIKLLLKAQIMAAIGNIVINAILIPKYGAVGAALATLVSSILCATVQYFDLCKQIKLQGLLKQGVKYISIGIIMFLAVKIITIHMNANVLTTIIQGIIGIAVYFGICFIIRDEQFIYMLGTLKKRLKR